MKVLEQIGALVKALVTTTQELAHQRKALADLENQFDAMEQVVQGLRERMARMEAFQDAIRAEVAAELSKLKAGAEQAEMRLTRLLDDRLGERRRKKG